MTEYVVTRQVWLSSCCYTGSPTDLRLICGRGLHPAELILRGPLPWRVMRSRCHSSSRCWGSRATMWASAPSEASPSSRSCAGVGKGRAHASVVPTLTHFSHRQPLTIKPGSVLPPPPRWSTHTLLMQRSSISTLRSTHTSSPDHLQGQVNAQFFDFERTTTPQRRS